MAKGVYSHQSFPQSVSYVLPIGFYSIHQANQCLVILTNECLKFVGQNLDPKQHTLQNQHSNSHRQHLLTSLGNWQETYDKFCEGATGTETSGRAWKKQSAFMLIQRAWLSIVVSTSYLECKETDVDAHSDDFRTIVELASVVLPEQKIQDNCFSLELGIVAPLYWTVMTCRHPRIRREALRLLERADREGLWDPDLLTQVARECIKLEEENISSDEDILLTRATLDRNEDWARLVPLQCRVGEARLFASDDGTYYGVTFHRRQWVGSGKCIGKESIVRRLPSTRKSYLTISTP